MSYRYISTHPLPTPYERELLTILIEECAEVQKAATKLLRFGRDDGAPGGETTNGDDLGMEIGDLLQMIDLALLADLIQSSRMVDGRKRKRAKLAVYMQTENEASRQGDGK